MSVLMSEKKETLDNVRIKSLIGEIQRGEIKVDTLINASYDFSRNIQALYFSCTRKNLKSDMADMIINHGQSTADIDILKGIIRK